MITCTSSLFALINRVSTVALWKEPASNIGAPGSESTSITDSKGSVRPETFDFFDKSVINFCFSIWWLWSYPCRFEDSFRSESLDHSEVIECNKQILSKSRMYQLLNQPNWKRPTICRLQNIKRQFFHHMKCKLCHARPTWTDIEDELSLLAVPLWMMCTQQLTGRVLCTLK